MKYSTFCYKIQGGIVYLKLFPFGVKAEEMNSYLHSD